MKLAIVTTTINLPTFLEGYCVDATKHKHHDLLFIVVGDRKTPTNVAQYCRGLEERFGFSCEYAGVEEQEHALVRYPELAAYLPWDSVQRRNIGMVRAYELGAEVILTVDDDNYLLEPDLLRYHLMVGTRRRLEAFQSATGWFDPCRFLREKRGIPFYHRGFPLGERWKEGEEKRGMREGMVVANVGLWHGDPDVDAWARLAFPLEVVACERQENFTLASGTWAPFNSQQTALRRDVLPAYFLNPNAGRYDDIFASYILHRIAEHFEDIISYGHPIVLHEQKRSLASLWRDIEDERVGSQLTTPFTQALRMIVLTGTTYRECFAEIAAGLRQWIDHAHFPLSDARAFLEEYLCGMEVWRRTIERSEARIP